MADVDDDKIEEIFNAELERLQAAMDELEDVPQEEPETIADAFEIATSEPESSNFIINPTTGSLSFRNPPDYENPTDDNLVNSYDIYVNAEDSEGNISSQWLEVDVTDLQEGVIISISNATVINTLNIGWMYELNSIRDFDGNLHAGAGSSAEDQYKYQGLADLNQDGNNERIFTNAESERWASLGVDSITGQTNFDDYGAGGDTRVVGTYNDPLVLIG